MQIVTLDARRSRLSSYHFNVTVKVTSGELALRPLPALLLDLQESMANGRLTIKRGRIIKHFDLVNGNPMSARSTPRDETLGHFLVGGDVITDVQHQEAIARSAASGDRLGETLVAMGAMTLETLFEQLRKQARHKLISALRWPQGAWNFDPTADNEGGMALRMTDVVLLGLKETTNEDVERWNRLDQLSFILTPRGQRLRSELRKVFGEALVERVATSESSVRFSDVMQGSNDPVLVRSALDSMLLCEAMQGRVLVRPQSRGLESGTVAIAEDSVVATLPSSRESTSIRQQTASHTSTSSSGSHTAQILPPIAPRAIDIRPSGPSAMESLHSAPATMPRQADPSTRLEAPATAMPRIELPSIRPLPRSPASAGSLHDGRRSAAPTGAIIAGAGSASVPRTMSRNAKSNTLVEDIPIRPPAAMRPAPPLPPVPPLPSLPKTTSQRLPVPAIVERASKPATSQLPLAGTESTFVSRTSTSAKAALDDLFDSVGHGTQEGAVPIATDDEESGRVSTGDVQHVHQQLAEAGENRRRLAAELSRVRGLDHYGVLMVASNASSMEIATAIAERRSAFSKDYVGRWSLGLDRHKLDDLHAFYDKASAHLLDDAARARYDIDTNGGDSSLPPTYQADLRFRAAEELMAGERWQEAVDQLQIVVAQSPQQADYLAALGWSLWRHHGGQADAIDIARSALNQALQVNPDHGQSHQYRGLIEAVAGTDIENALFHLERALEIDASRTTAMDELERLLVSRGELRRFERVCKRAMFRLRGNSGAELAACLRLARFYLIHLDERASAESTLQRAKEISPDSSDIVTLEQLLTYPATARGSLDPARAFLTQDPTNASAASAYVSAAEHNGIDAAFLAAAVVHGLGTADAAATALYQQKRLKYPVLPNEIFMDHDWAKLRHPDDSAELGELMNLLAPAVIAMAPILPEDVELDESALIAPNDLPASFEHALSEIARTLNMAVPAVYARSDLAEQVHVIATNVPVLVAGDEALRSALRPELLFRIARALSLATPARAVGGSRSGRILKAAVLAALRQSTNGPRIDIDDMGLQADAAVAALSAADTVLLRSYAARFLARGQPLNMSAWSRALVRTADRFALLWCGDPSVGFAVAREMGELHSDLIEFAVSPAHTELRAALHIAL